MITERIYKYYEDTKSDKKPRYHLGASHIGEDCERSIWLKYRWFDREYFNGRMLRLLETGVLAESRFAKDLESIGIKVELFQEGFQYKVSALSGHFGGSLDGIATNVDPQDPDRKYILEFKTHNERSFNDLKKHGVDVSKPNHYMQMQVYMGLSGIHDTIYLAVNKNTDELYEETVVYDHQCFERCINKARRILTLYTPPARINDNPSFFKCKLCPMNQICHFQKEPNKSCRTCIHSTPSKDGLWECRLYSRILNEEEQVLGCKNYEPIQLG